MITELMKLTTARDADQWAGDMLENCDYTTAGITRLSNWLWDNFAGKNYGEIRDQMPEGDAFWDIVYGK